MNLGDYARLNLWLTEVNGGRAMFTHHPPIIQAIDYTEILDAFPRLGEPIAVQHACQAGVRLLINARKTGLVLRPLTPVQIELLCRVRHPEKLMAWPGGAPIRRQMEGGGS